jgi:polyisoprenoid-binding protein YceI
MFARALLSLAATATLVAPLTAQTRLTLAPTGNEARYIVRELLAANTIENDVIGKTDAVSGTISLDAEGKVVPAMSRITVALTGLKTDRDRRDGYVQNRTLNTAEHPTTTLQVTELRGAPTPLPTSGTFTFTLVGDLTLKGVTKPTTWTVTAVASRTGFTGTAKTSFTFAEFELTKPRVPVVARVDDPITLELQFNFVRE